MGNVQVNVQAPVYYAAAGRIEPLTATDALALPDGSSYVRVGKFPGSGAGSGAATGALRIPNATGIYSRIQADTSDLNIARTTAANELIVGSVSSTVYIDAYGAVQLRTDNQNKLRASTGLTAGVSMGLGYSTLFNDWAQASAQFAAAGDSQNRVIELMRASTDAGAVELTITGGAPAAGTRLAVPAGYVFGFAVDLLCICNASTGADLGAVARWVATGTIKNIAGTTALVGTTRNLVGGLWLDIAGAGNDVPGWADAALAAATLAITADNANDCLALTVTGIDPGATVNNYRWTAKVSWPQVGY